jgi:hypothetical protein
VPTSFPVAKQNSVPDIGGGYTYIGARVLISVADLRRFSRGDHPARLAG